MIQRTQIPGFSGDDFFTGCWVSRHAGAAFVFSTHFGSFRFLQVRQKLSISDNEKGLG